MRIFRRSFRECWWSTLSDRLFGGYLQRTYAYHLEKGPAFFSYRLTNAIERANESVIAVQQISIELLTGLLILTLVVAANPFAAFISVLGMVVPAGMIYRVLRKRLLRFGIDQHKNWERRIGMLYTGISAIKDIKVLGSEHFFHQS